MAEVGAEPRYEDDEINLRDYWRVLWKYRWLIAILFSVSVIAGLILSLLSPKIYESKVTIIAPREGGGSGLLSALGASGLAQQISGLSIPSLTPNRDLYLSVLRSKTIVQTVVEQFNLKEYYKARHVEDAIRSLRGATKISMSREGVIEIQVEDNNPALAADIANAYTDQLDRMIAQFGTGAAGRHRGFIKEQLVKTEKDLKAAEEALRHFQEKNRAVSVSDQAKGAIEGAAKLKGEIMAAEVQLQVIRNFATDSNPDVIRLRRQIGELKRQLGQAQYSAGLELPAVTDNPGHPQQEIYVPPARVPKLSLELARLTRDLKVQETVYILLNQQLEQAKFSEAQDTPIVQVLDRAVPAIYKSKPKIRLNMAIAGAVSLFFGIFLAFLLEYLERQRALVRESRP